MRICSSYNWKYQTLHCIYISWRALCHGAFNDEWKQNFGLTERRVVEKLPKLFLVEVGSLYSRVPYLMFKIEVFNALETRFGPSKYASLKTTTQPQIENENVT